MTEDIRVENHGSIFLLQPLTQAAATWLFEHTDKSAQWFAGAPDAVTGALVVEPRYVADIVAGARADGLEVN